MNTIPEKMRQRLNAGSMLAHCRRRLTNIVLILGHYLVFAGVFDRFTSTCGFLPRATSTHNNLYKGPFKIMVAVLYIQIQL